MHGTLETQGQCIPHLSRVQMEYPASGSNDSEDDTNSGSVMAQVRGSKIYPHSRLKSESKSGQELLATTATGNFGSGQSGRKS